MSFSGFSLTPPEPWLASSMEWWSAVLGNTLSPLLEGTLAPEVDVALCAVVDCLAHARARREHAMVSALDHALSAGVPAPWLLERAASAPPLYRHMIARFGGHCADWPRSVPSQELERLAIARLDRAFDEEASPSVTGLLEHEVSLIRSARRRVLDEGPALATWASATNQVGLLDAWIEAGWDPSVSIPGRLSVPVAARLEKSAWTPLAWASQWEAWASWDRLWSSSKVQASVLAKDETVLLLVKGLARPDVSSLSFRAQLDRLLAVLDSGGSLATTFPLHSSASGVSGATDVCAGDRLIEILSSAKGWERLESAWPRLRLFVERHVASPSQASFSDWQWERRLLSDAPLSPSRRAFLDSVWRRFPAPLPALARAAWSCASPDNEGSPMAWARTAGVVWTLEDMVQRGHVLVDAPLPVSASSSWPGPHWGAGLDKEAAAVWGGTCGVMERLMGDTTWDQVVNCPSLRSALHLALDAALSPSVTGRCSRPRL